MSLVLIIDDEPQLCELIAHLVQEKGHQAEYVNSLCSGLARVQAGDVDLIYLDIHMPDGNGLDVLAELRSSVSRPEVIIMTGMTNPDGAELAIRSGAWDYVAKGSPFTSFTLPMLRALQFRQEKLARTSETTLQLDGIIGNSPQISACYDALAQAAYGDANVLISSETGTGKELFARAIHDNSRRSSRPFIVVDCAALPEQLVESVLFGHRQGAFTGAFKTQAGLVKQADGGTLFLDEVGELPLPVQKSFLRVLQEHRFRPIGSDREESSDFRLIAATNRDLSDLAAGGKFREDLLYRLRGHEVSLPSLQKRREDIEPIAVYHISNICSRYGIQKKGLSQEFTQCLLRYEWPGNIRELVNTMEHVVAAAEDSSTLYPHHLPTEIRAHLARLEFEPTDKPPRSAGMKGSGLSRDVPLPALNVFRDAAIDECERTYLGTLLARHGDSIREACQVSGLSRSRLYALFQKHDIARPHLAHPKT